MKTKLLICAGIAIGFGAVAYLGFRVGQTKAAIDSSWIPKEHVILAGSMERIEHSLAKGDTGTVLRAVAAYNQRARVVTNEFDYYLAAMALWESSTNRP